MRDPLSLCCSQCEWTITLNGVLVTDDILLKLLDHSHSHWVMTCDTLFPATKVERRDDG
jgi:hypothetical protein